MIMELDDENYSFEELTKPIKTVEEKWKLLPHFLKMRGDLFLCLVPYHSVCDFIDRINEAAH